MSDRQVSAFETGFFCAPAWRLAGAHNSIDMPVVSRAKWLASQVVSQLWLALKRGLIAAEGAREMSKRVIAVIAGTGLAADLAKALDGAEIHENVSVTFGSRSGSVLHYVSGNVGDLRIIILPRHGPTVEIPDRSPAELVHLQGHEAHIWHFHELGVERVYGFNSVGALDDSVPLASEKAFLVPDDYARGFGAISHSFGALALDVHPSMDSPFDQAMRELLIEATRAAGAHSIDGGLYIHSAGDAFEAPAESRAYRRMFEDSKNRVVGMTSGAEVVLCKQMKIPFALICANCNWAQGLAPGEKVTHEHVLKGMRPAVEAMRAIARNLISLEAGR
jgi:5'-methylthioinosine phosphorylase